MKKQKRNIIFILPRIHVLVLIWCFCFVLIVGMVVWINLVFHSGDRKPEGKAVSLSSLANKSLNFNLYDVVDVHTACTCTT